MSLLFAVASAVLLGSSDFCAARAARTTPAVTVTRSAVLVSMMLSPVLLVMDWSWIWRDIVLGLGSGLTMTLGLMLLYRGYAVARMGIVAPMSSVLLAAVPVALDVARGDSPSPLGSLGMAIGLFALVLTSYTPGGTGSIRLGAVLGVGSGVLFGVAFALMGEVSAESGLVPVVFQRLVGFVLLMSLAVVIPAPFVARGRRARLYVAATGTLAIAAIASLQFAFQQGASGPVAVAASQFATVAVVLSVLFNGERMRWWQSAGIAATALGVSLMALGA